jgi:disease resistance protein RPM1
MTKLREVGFSLLGNDAEVAEDVGELEHLQELILYVDDIDFGTEVLQKLAQSLSKSYSLRRLIIGDMGYGKTLNFLHTLPTPPRLLRYLMIAGGIDTLPSWIGKLTYLDQINISWGRFVGDQPFDVLCNCPSLKTIIIHTMCYVGPELVARTKHTFPELANLRVSSSSTKPDIIRFEKGSMVNLQTLLVNMTNNEDKRIVGIEHLTSIKEVQLWGNKNNTAVGRALEQLKNENLRRHQESNEQFQIVVKYK